MVAHKILILTRFCNFKQLFCDVRYGMFFKEISVVVAHIALNMESAQISIESECSSFQSSKLPWPLSVNLGNILTSLNMLSAINESPLLSDHHVKMHFIQF